MWHWELKWILGILYGTSGYWLIFIFTARHRKLFSQIFDEAPNQSRKSLQHCTKCRTEPLSQLPDQLCWCAEWSDCLLGKVFTHCNPQELWITTRAGPDTTLFKASHCLPRLAPHGAAGHHVFRHLCSLTLAHPQMLNLLKRVLQFFSMQYPCLFCPDVLRTHTETPLVESLL